ncbi:MAG: DUF2213 domain-containing protein [Mesorhizobium sp.]|nr:DUF2213 domain-containing protein [Mesorhizobium sp.]MCO5085145.1 DUF2213 domain-containing protein [Rhizobiaceae bacterium]MCO5164678.1 DUF2213 domain-containing protein [Mesorhizobium sp.]
MKFTDAVSIAGTRRRDDGYLVADARVARTGVQLYAGYEVGKPEMAVVRVYRPDAEVFSRDTLASFAHRPVTNDHPAEPVTADNWKDHAVGNTSDEVARDGSMIRVPLMVSDGATIKLIEDGKRELSAGYTCDLAFETGQTASGEAYDAIQKNIRANHVAIVQRGRAGSEVRIGDDAGKWGASPVTPQTADERTSQMADALRKVLVDGLQVETTDAGAQAIDKLQKDLASSAAKIDTLTADHATALAAKDAELAKAHAERDAANAKILDAAALDKLVQARGDLIATAKAIAADVKTDGLSDAEIRKAVVVAKLGDAAVKDKAEAYIDARFDILAEDAAKSVDPVRAALQSQDRAPLTNDNGQAAYEKRLSDAWKPKKEA